MYVVEYIEAKSDNWEQYEWFQTRAEALRAARELLRDHRDFIVTVVYKKQAVL